MPIRARPGTKSLPVSAGWRAAQLAALTDIPVVVRELSDQEAVAIALVENIQREDLRPAEEARALQGLVADFQLMHHAVADAVGRSRVAVSNLIRLLDVPAEVVALVDSKALGMTCASAPRFGDDAERVRLARWLAERNLSVRAIEALVRNTLDGKGRAAPAAPPELSVVSEVLRTPDVRVQLQQKSAGSGKLIVEFADTSVRDTIVAAIKAAISS